MFVSVFSRLSFTFSIALLFSSMNLGALVTCIPDPRFGDQPFTMQTSDGWKPIDSAKPADKTTFHQSKFVNPVDNSEMHVECIQVPSSVKQYEARLIADYKKKGIGRFLRLGRYSGGVLDVTFGYKKPTFRYIVMDGHEHIDAQVRFDRHPTPEQISCVEKMLASVQIFQGSPNSAK